MAEVVRMPKMSDTMTDGVIVKWHKKVGDTVKAGELMAEIETDKATMDYESYSEGVLLHLGAKEGEALAIDDVLAILGKSGEDFSHLLSPSSSKDPEAKPTPPPIISLATSAPAASIRAELVLMPKMSDTMTDGVIVKWYKKVGDTVKAGELMAEIETDKATMDYESYHSGTLLYQGAQEKEAIAVNDALAIVGEKDADWKALLTTHSKPANTPAPAADASQRMPHGGTSATTSGAATPARSHTTEERLKASPLARKLAKEKGYDLIQIQGSGDGGRIVKRDVEQYHPGATTNGATATPWLSGQESYDDLPLSQTRKAIARRLSESKFSAPHFYLTVAVRMEKAIAARVGINEVAPIKVSFNDMVIKATAAALRLHTDVNVSWRENALRRYGHIHMGIAVAVDGGLLVPVIRFADRKSLSQIAAEVKEVAQKAKDKKLQPADMEGSTFTISNLGMFGIDQFTAIINPPNACILAVGGIQETPVVDKGQLAVGHVMKITLSCDHRAVDGALGSAFLNTLKLLLEDPVRMLA